MNLLSVEDFENHRQAVRVWAELPVVLKTPLEAEARTINVSLAGILIDRLVKLPMGEEILMSLYTSSGIVNLLGTIVRLNRDRKQTAIKLPPLSPRNEEALNHPIMEMQRKLLNTARNVRSQARF